MKSAAHNIMNQKPNKILIDSSNLLHRVVWITESGQRKISPVYIFLTSVKKYADKFECNNIYSVWDKRLIRGVKNYRRQAKQADYKGNRDTAKNERVFSFEDETTEILSALGVKNMYPGILEADDVISWMSKETKGNKMIVSVDQDMLQLVDEKTSVYSPIKDIIITNENFEEVVGVPREQFLRYKSLIGDKSDNLPGVERCGKKTAAKLLEQCETDQLLEEKLGSEKIKPYYFNLKMIDLEYGLKQHPDDVELYQEQYNKHKQTAPDFDKFIDLCKSRNFNKIITDSYVWKERFTETNTTRTLENIVNTLGLSK